MLVDGKLIVEIKTVDSLSVLHEARIQPGLLLNFATHRVQVRRPARSK
jgi:hypothetical protein